MPIIILFLLILVHELGHFLFALLFHVEVDKIYIYPFGGISKFYLALNEDLWKEFIILIMGPIFQFLFYFILLKIDYLSHDQKMISVYNFTLLFFNLLPIYPLDGGKLLNIILSSSFSFKKSLNITFLVSYFTIFLFSSYFLVHYFSLNSIIIISFLLYKVKKEERSKSYLFDKFLLERYLYHYQFKKRKRVTDMNEFMRNRNHLIRKGSRYYTERELLYKKFNNRY